MRVVVSTDSQLDVKMFDNMIARKTATISPTVRFGVCGARGCRPMLSEPRTGSLSPRRNSTPTMNKQWHDVADALDGDDVGPPVVVGELDATGCHHADHDAAHGGADDRRRLPKSAAPRPNTTNRTNSDGWVLCRNTMPAIPARTDASTQLAPARNCGE